MIRLTDCGGGPTGVTAPLLTPSVYPRGDLGGSAVPGSLLPHYLGRVGGLSQAWDGGGLSSFLIPGH